MSAVLAVPAFEPGLHVLMATRTGTVKKTDLMAYSRPRTGGIIALGLAEGDELIAVKLSDGTQNVFLGSAMGKSIGRASHRPDRLRRTRDDPGRG